MPQPVILNDEQFAMLKRLEDATKRFTDEPKLRSQQEAIEAARKLIDEAHKLKMPEAAIHGLRIYVNMFDIETDLEARRKDK
jgi:hypothetical protein